MKHLYKFNEFLNESENYKSEKWSEEYILLNLYYYKFGLNKIGIRDENQLADIMNVKVGSIQMHNRQFIRLGVETGKLDGNDSGLGKIGFNVRLVFYKYDVLSEMDIREKAEEILDLISEKNYTNSDFLKMKSSDDEEFVENLKNEWVEKKRKEISNKPKLISDLKNILSHYIFDVGEKVTLKHKSWSEPRECVITVGGKNPKFKYDEIEIDRNRDFEMGPLFIRDFDIVYPHNIGPQYSNIKIGWQNWNK